MGDGDREMCLRDDEGLGCRGRGLLGGSQGVGDEGIGFHPSLDVEAIGSDSGSWVFQSSIGCACQSLVLFGSVIVPLIGVSAIVDRMFSHGSANSFPSAHKGVFKTLGSVNWFVGIGMNVNSLSWAGRGALGFFLWNSSTFSGAFFTLVVDSQVHSWRSGYPTHWTRYWSLPRESLESLISLTSNSSCPSTISGGGGRGCCCEG